MQVVQNEQGANRETANAGKQSTLLATCQFLISQLMGYKMLPTVFKIY